MTIINYIKYRRFGLVMWGLCTAVSVGVSVVGGLRGMAAVYGALVSGFFALVICVFDYRRCSQFMAKLSEAGQNISAARAALPEPINQSAELYTEIIDKLYSTISRERNLLGSAAADQVEYYTTWLHQIKTPISAMQLTIEGGLSQDSAPLLSAELFKVERYVDMALQNAKLSNLESDMVLAHHKLDELIVDVIKKYSPLFILKKLSVDFQRTGLTLATDGKWLSFILEQLLSNAVKYTNSGGIKIYAKGNTLVVEDSGIGIRSDDIERIFERGYTGYNGRSDRRASGLGLYMSRRIADRLHIRISADRDFTGGARLLLDLGSLQPNDFLTKM